MADPNAVTQEQLIEKIEWLRDELRGDIDLIQQRLDSTITSVNGFVSEMRPEVDRMSTELNDLKSKAPEPKDANTKSGATNEKNARHLSDANQKLNNLTRELTEISLVMETIKEWQKGITVSGGGPIDAEYIQTREFHFATIL